MSSEYERDHSFGAKSSSQTTNFVDEDINTDIDILISEVQVRSLL